MSIWLSTKKAAPKAKINKKPKPVIVYPLFEEATEYTTSDFWKNELIKCAQGNIRKPFIFEDNKIYYLKNKSKNTYIEIETENPAKICKLFINFLKLNGNVFPNEEEEEDDEEKESDSEEEKESDSEDDEDDYKWSDLKRKNKHHVMSHYLDSLKEAYSLKMEDRRYLQLRKLLMQDGFKKRFYQGSDPNKRGYIEIYKKNIQTISGLLLNEETGVFYLEGLENSESDDSFFIEVNENEEEDNLDFGDFKSDKISKICMIYKKDLEKRVSVKEKAKKQINTDLGYG